MEFKSGDFHLFKLPSDLRNTWKNWLILDIDILKITFLFTLTSISLFPISAQISSSNTIKDIDTSIVMDKLGRKNGVCLEFNAQRSEWQQGKYKHGKRDSSWVEDLYGEPRYKFYKHGVLLRMSNLPDTISIEKFIYSVDTSHIYIYI